MGSAGLAIVARGDLPRVVSRRGVVLVFLPVVSVADPGLCLSGCLPHCCLHVHCIGARCRALASGLHNAVLATILVLVLTMRMDAT